MKEAVRLEEIGVGGGNAEAVRAMFDSIASRDELGTGEGARLVPGAEQAGARF